MRTLTVSRTIPAPIDEVFDAYTDHEKLSQVLGVRSCRLTREGETEKNGLGAIRELDCGAIWLREQITGFDRPSRMEYSITKSRPRSRHEYGRVDFIETPGGTTVTWSTRFAVRAPGIGKLVEPAFGVGFGVAFRMVLRNVEQRVLTCPH
ncbi:MAG: SRPBCC family protein [Conexibacteraceae bacterium]|nr:SRPBCC family protein [Conexibacteraceae bacterium]